MCQCSALYTNLVGAYRATLRLFAKGAVHSPEMYRLDYRLRGQVRSHRPLPLESSLRPALRFQPRFPALHA
ncbi:hypothetical protein FOM00_09010 [Pseudomonas sp. ST1]|nr:hypothetical protein DXU85_08120 [Pseudomonas savastanoi]TSC37380.1 hypothetical protein FOM00_09010 [Pseudomonas sp. ST1]